jgi:DNA-directed RNA polymerase subunit RPC12/RpoP
MTPPDYRCPRCGEIVPPRTQALSRFDNKTYICSPCGTAEGIWAMAGQPLPDLDTPVRLPGQFVISEEEKHD